MSKNNQVIKEGDTVTLDLVIDDENEADPDNFDESTAREVVCLRILSSKTRFRFGGLEITVKSPAFEVGKTFSVSLDEQNRLAGIESFKQEQPYLPPLYSSSSQGNSSPNDSRTVTPLSSRPSSRRVSLVGSLGLKPARIVVNPSSANENNEGLPWLSARMTLEEDLAAAVQAVSTVSAESPGAVGRLSQSPNAAAAAAAVAVAAASSSSQPESENESCNLVATASSSNGKCESKRGSRKGNKSRSERNSSSSGSSKNSSSAWKSNKSPSISSGSLGSSNAPNVASTSSAVTVATASNVTNVSTSPIASGKSSAPCNIPPGRRSPCSPCLSPATSPSTSPYRRTPSPFKRFFQKTLDETLRSSTATTTQSSSSESKLVTGPSPSKSSTSKKNQKKFVSVGVGTTSNPKESLYFDLERTFRRAKSWKK